jgi:hypothetical protein
MQSHWQSLAAGVVVGALMAGLMGCASNRLKSQQSYEKLKPIDDVPLGTSAPNLVIEINGVADTPKSVKNQARLLINGKEIQPEGSSNSRANYTYRLQVANGVYEVKAFYQAKSFWKDKEYEIATLDGKASVFPNRRTVLAITLDKKSNGQLKQEKNYFAEKYETLTESSSHTGVATPESRSAPGQVEKTKATQVFPINFVNEPAAPPAPEIAPAPNRSGTIALQINTVPLHCDVIVDDKYMGQSPLTIYVVRSSSHVVQISREGYAEKMKVLDRQSLGNDATYLLLEKLEPKK